MNQPELFTLPLADHRRLDGLVNRSSRPGERPTVVICHGFKGFIEWGFFPYLAELLADRGLTVVRFNFPGSGMQPGDELVTDPEAFAHATFSQDLADLRALLAALGDQVAPGLVDLRRLGLFGHSRGGGTALLAAADAHWSSRIRALVTWSAVSTYDRLTDAEKLRWRQQGWTPVVNARTGQELVLDRRVLDDLEQHREALDLLAAAERRQAPWLLVHGDADETVPVSEARTLAEHAAGEGCLIEIPQASHTFGVTHPFAGPTPQLVTALNATQDWFRKELT
jgi:pimeloyl-ACP methyl ester carboxylesterase